MRQSPHWMYFGDAKPHDGSIVTCQLQLLYSSAFGEATFNIISGQHLGGVRCLHVNPGSLVRSELLLGELLGWNGA